MASPNEPGFIYRELAAISRTLGSLEQAGQERLRGQQDLDSKVSEVLEKMADVRGDVTELRTDLTEHRERVHGLLNKLQADLLRSEEKARAEKEALVALVNFLKTGKYIGRVTTWVALSVLPIYAIVVQFWRAR